MKKVILLPFILLVIITAGLLSHYESKRYDTALTETKTTNPQVKKADTTTSTPRTLMTVTTHGGLCPNGEACISTTTFKTDGTYTTKPAHTNQERRGAVNPLMTKHLEHEIEVTDFDSIRKNRFTDICPLAYDGEELTYTFYKQEGSEIISSCETKIDSKHNLFMTANRLLKEVNRLSFK